MMKRLDDKMKIVFMGTPDFAVASLEEIIKRGYDINLVITQKDKKRGRGKKMQFTPVKEKALEFGLEVYQPDDVNSLESLEKLRSINPDIIIVVAYGQILREDILSLPKYGCLNVHASILPKYRGAAPINWAIINGEDISGNSIMKMDKGLDTGDVLNRSEIDIDDQMNAGQLHDILMIDGAKLLIDTLENIENLSAKKQDDENSSYAPMMDKSLGRIDWKKPNIDIYNLIRGTQPWPGSYFFYYGENVKVKKAELSNRQTSSEPGSIIEIDDNGILVQTGEGCISLKEIQFPGKKSMKVEEYLRGNEIEKIILD
ncbi:MAG: methionyl-tRNA formyltransferase [Andreesenia angusta]|nr:methionyl-tRNA formyltransferase [Andreesenia angusta]